MRCSSCSRCGGSYRRRMPVPRSVGFGRAQRRQARRGDRSRSRVARSRFRGKRAIAHCPASCTTSPRRCAPEGLGSLENLCDASGASVTNPADIVFGWLYDVVAYTSDGRVISDTHECVPFPDPNDRSAPPPPADAAGAADDRRGVARGPARPVVGVNPVSRGVTGLDDATVVGRRADRAGRGDDRRLHGDGHRARRRVPIRHRRGLSRRGRAG